MPSTSKTQTQSRIHISLDVASLENSVSFYQTLFDVAPSKLYPDYAKFEPGTPALNLALNPTANPSATSRVSHFGIELDSPDAVVAATKRLQDAGMTTTLEEAVTCCYAVQDKLWVTDPDGNAWEIYVVIEANTDVHSAREVGASFDCCPTKESAGCCNP